MRRPLHTLIQKQDLVRRSLLQRLHVQVVSLRPLDRVAVVCVPDRAREGGVLAGGEFKEGEGGWEGGDDDVETRLRRKC